MSTLALIKRVAERPRELTVQLGDGEVIVRRVSPKEAMSAAGLSGNQDDPNAWLRELVALSVAEGDAKPLDNAEGRAAIAELAPGDFGALASAAMEVNGFDQPGKK
jgi:hypothetical protein